MFKWVYSEDEMLNVQPGYVLKCGWQGNSIELKNLCTMIDTINYQCFENLKKGDSVQYRNKMHRVQEDKGWLFIQVTDNGKRVKKDAKSLLMKAGTKADWIFNGWFEKYDFETYRSFATAEAEWC